MSNRGVDAIYFLAFLLVVLLGYFVARSTEDDDRVASVDIPDFSFAGVDFEFPVNLSYSFAKFAAPAAPQFALSENTEAVRRQLRSALLESSSLVEVKIEVKHDAQIASVVGSPD